jgi:hypothetical protein
MINHYSSALCTSNERVYTGKKKKQGVDGGKGGIKINSTVNDHREKSYWQN